MFSVRTWQEQLTVHCSSSFSSGSSKYGNRHWYDLEPSTWVGSGGGGVGQRPGYPSIGAAAIAALAGMN
jgi:hypothetical protein